MRKRSQGELRAIFGKEKQNLLTERSRETIPNQIEMSSERLRVEKEKKFAREHPDILVINRGNFPADVFRRVR